MFKKAINSSILLKVITVIVTMLFWTNNNSYGQVFQIPIVSPDNTTGLSYPISKFGFSRWEAIYPASEINHSGYLTKIKFACSREADAVIYKNIRVFAQSVNLDSLSLPDNYFDSTSYALIYEGDLCVPPESDYAEIQLTVPFFYNYEYGNLMLAIERNDNSYAGGNNTNPWFQTVSGSSGVNRYGSSSGVMPNYLYNISSLPYIELELGCLFHIPIQDKHECYGTNRINVGNIMPVFGGGGSNYTYSWDPPDYLDNPTIQNPISFAKTSQHYNLIIQSDGCSGWVETMTLFVDEEQPEIMMGQQSVVSAHSGTFYDSGGSKTGYNNDEDYTLTIYPCDNQNDIDINFTDFDIDNDGDWLKIYNGDNTGCDLLGTYSGSENIGEFISTHGSGALTFVFHSDGATSGNGWAAYFRETPDCRRLTTMGTALISSEGDDLHSGEATLSLDGNSNYFIMWQKSYDGSNFTEIRYSESTYRTGINNTTTYYRALFRTNYSDLDCPSNVVTYSSSNNYYVNDDNPASDKWCTAVGSSSYDGLSVDKPINSLYSIIQGYDLKKGDTIFVDAGTYYENIDINGYDYGNIDDTTYRIVFLGAGKDLTHIKPQYNYQPILINSTFGFEFNGLDVRDSANSWQSNNSNYVSQFNIGNSSNVLIQNCSFINNTVNTNIEVQGNNDWSGNLLKIRNNYFRCDYSDIYGNTKNIIFYCKFNDCNISNNIIFNSNDTYWSEGIYFNLYNYNSQNLIINRNYIRTTGRGIDFNAYIGDASLKNIELTNNYIDTKNIDGSSAIYSYGVINSDSVNKISNNYLKGGITAIEASYGNISNTKIYNNFIYGSPIGISLSSSANNVGIYSNSFYNSKTNINYSGLTSSGGLNLKNNIFYNTSTSSTDYCLSMDECSNNGNGNKLDTCDYNLFYAPNGAKLAKFGSTQISNISALKTVDHVVGSGLGDESSIYGDPKYYDASSGNLMPLSSSPAIGNGTHINGINHDISYHDLSSSLVSIGASIFPKPLIKGQFAELKRKLDGGYHLVYESPYLLFRYNEEYNPLTSRLKYKIYDDISGTIIISSEQANGFVNDVPNKYGENFCALSLFGCGSCNYVTLTSGSFYLLEVNNDKNEKWYLRFKYSPAFTNNFLCPCYSNYLPFELQQYSIISQ